MARCRHTPLVVDDEGMAVCRECGKPYPATTEAAMALMRRSGAELADAVWDAVVDALFPDSVFRLATWPDADVKAPWWDGLGYNRC